jgi:hypothetical protein
LIWVLFHRLGMVGLIVAVVVTFARQSDLNSKAKQTRHALCTFRADLTGRRNDLVKYRDDVNTGRRKPVPGITKADINTSLRNQNATLRSLRSLACD